MAKDIRSIARALDAQVVGRLPDVGGGACGAARLAKILQQRLRPSRGRDAKSNRPGRPTVASWAVRPKVPMSKTTAAKLKQIAREASRSGRRVSAMQVAAQLLEDAVSRFGEG
jgi:hypothetical protein